MSSTVWNSREDNRTEGEVKPVNQYKRYKRLAFSEKVQQFNRLT